MAAESRSLLGRFVRLKGPIEKGARIGTTITIHQGAVLMVEGFKGSGAGMTLNLGDTGGLLQVWNVPRVCVNLLPAERACKHCGCTQFNPCAGGCCWVSRNECSACRQDLFDKKIAERNRTDRSPLRSARAGERRINRPGKRKTA